MKRNDIKTKKRQENALRLGNCRKKLTRERSLILQHHKSWLRNIMQY